MTRSLTAGVIAEIATNKLNPVELVYLGISTGTYYTDHYKDLNLSVYGIACDYDFKDTIFSNYNIYKYTDGEYIQHRNASFIPV